MSPVPRLIDFMSPGLPGLGNTVGGYLLSSDRGGEVEMHLPGL